MGLERSAISPGSTVKSMKANPKRTWGLCISPIIQLGPPISTRALVSYVPSDHTTSLCCGESAVESITPSVRTLSAQEPAQTRARTWPVETHNRRDRRTARSNPDRASPPVVRLPHSMDSHAIPARPPARSDRHALEARQGQGRPPDIGAARVRTVVGVGKNVLAVLRIPCTGHGLPV